MEQFPMQFDNRSSPEIDRMALSPKTKPPNQTVPPSLEHRKKNGGSLVHSFDRSRQAMISPPPSIFFFYPLCNFRFLWYHNLLFGNFFLFFQQASTSSIKTTVLFLAYPSPLFFYRARVEKKSFCKLFMIKVLSFCLSFPLFRPNILFFFLLLSAAQFPHWDAVRLQGVWL